MFHRSRTLASAFAFAFATLAASTSQAYFSTIDTGELIAPGHYQVGLEPQLILSNFSGLNAVGRFDAGINEDSNVRAILGFGKVDYQVGGFYKYVPFPDTRTQPAIGGEVGLLLARVNGNTENSIRLHPLVSKKLETEVGDVTPYGSIPFGITWRSTGETLVPAQLVGGAELRPMNHKDLSFFAELGLNLNNAFGYISGAIAWRFDEVKLKSRK